MIYLNSSQFKAISRNDLGIRDKSALPPDLIVQKIALGQPEVMPKRCLRFTLSTEAIDRDNDRISQKGWQLKNYKANPIVLWGHQGDQPPIGKVIEIGLEDGALKALVEFVPFDNPFNGPKAEGIYQMCQGGYISAVSVGFAPLEWDISEEEARSGKNYGVDFHSTELFELSIVSIPSNPEALIERPAAAEQRDASSQLNTATNNVGRRQRIVRYIEI